MIVSIGEVLIDFIGKGELKKAEYFRKCFGGAPANVARGIAALGGNAGMVAKVSDDGFGKFLYETLKGSGVDMGGVVVGKGTHTRLAFVSVREDGEREFRFYSEDCADEALGPDDVRGEYLKSASFLHFGSIGMMSESGGKATEKAVGIVRRNKGRISYDPNLRPMLWKDEEEMREAVFSGLKFADVLKVDAGELEFITGESGIEEGVRKLPRMELACVTLGKDGCYCWDGKELKLHKGHNAKAVDSTGAGDAFVSGLLFSLEKGRSAGESVGFANAVGAVSTFRRFPTLEEVERFIGGGGSYEGSCVEGR